MITTDEQKKKIARAFEKKVKGKRIAFVGYDSENFPYLALDDGSAIFIQRDDEGNGAGVAVHQITKPGNLKSNPDGGFNTAKTITTYLPEIY